MIFDFRNMTFSDDDWKYIILQYLKEWTEIPLNPNYGYDIVELKFFDGFLGTLLKQTEFFVKECLSEVNKEFVGSWKYQGKLYRVMHSHYVFNDNSIEPRIVMPKVNYHRMITHWTDDYTFEEYCFHHHTIPETILKILGFHCFLKNIYAWGILEFLVFDATCANMFHHTFHGLPLHIQGNIVCIAAR